MILLHFAEAKLLSRKLVVAVGSYETFHGFPGWYLWGEKFWQCEIELQPWFPYVILKIDLESFSEASYDISPSSSHTTIIFLTGKVSRLLLLFP